MTDQRDGEIHEAMRQASVPRSQIDPNVLLAAGKMQWNILTLMLQGHGWEKVCLYSWKTYINDDPDF